MSTEAPYFGIDFGTTNSSMAWFNPTTENTEDIKNIEGQDKIPSPVRFGESETLLGEPVEKLPKDVSTDGTRRGLRAHHHEHRAQFDLSPRIALPGGRQARPVDVSPRY